MLIEKKIDQQISRWKSKSIGKCTDAVATVLQLLRRIEESSHRGIVRCVTCGKTGHYKNGFHGGHYIPRQHKSTKLLSLNIWPQCIRCNKYLDGNLVEYRKFLGDRLASRLEALRYRVVNWSRYQLAKRIVIYRERVSFWESRLEHRPDRQSSLDF